MIRILISLLTLSISNANSYLQINPGDKAPQHTKKEYISNVISIFHGKLLGDELKKYPKCKELVFFDHLKECVQNEYQLGADAKVMEYLKEKSFFMWSTGQIISPISDNFHKQFQTSGFIYKSTHSKKIISKKQCSHNELNDLMKEYQIKVKSLTEDYENKVSEIGCRAKK